MTTTATGISLVMATLGRSDEVRVFLDSLLAQTDQAFELIVVDQNGDDRLVPIIAEAAAKGLPVRHERIARRGLSNARNHGLQFATFDVVGFPDDDCWYEPEVIEQLRSVFSASNGPDGVAGRWIEAEMGTPEVRGDFVLDEWRRFRAANASSITLFFRTGLCRRLGGFDTRLGVGEWFGVGEETDFVLRILASGARIEKFPRIRVHHRYGRNPSQPLGAALRNARRRGRGTGALYVKHRLSLWVVLRGLVGPIFIPLLSLKLVSVLLGGGVVLGRIEGAMRWMLVAR